MSVPARSRTLVVCGVILTGLLLVVAFSLDRDRSTPEPDDAIIEIAGPGPLTDEERRLALDDPTAPPAIPEGGWIQVAGDDGSLAQQYRFDRLDPSPDDAAPGWLVLHGPIMEIYARDGRVIELRGETARVFAPNEIMERGMLTGSVVIHLYEGIAGGTLDTDVDRPSARVRTEEASFDGVIGEIRCDGAIHMESDRGEFFGRRLTALFDDRADRMHRLRIEVVESIRLAMRSDGAGVSPLGPAMVRTRELTDDIEVYRLTLHDDVEIVQGPEDARRRATGDRLALFFALGGADERSVAGAPTGRPRSLSDLIASTALAITTQASGDDGMRLAPPLREDDAHVTCSGPLTIEADDRARSRLVSADDAVLELVTLTADEPVRLEDPAESAVVTAGRLEHHAIDDRVDLLRSTDHAVVMRTPQFDADAEHFWLSDRDGRGGFTGPGRARLRDEVDPALEPEEPTNELDLAWNDSVDLEFGRESTDADDPASPDGSASEGDLAALGALQRARFRGAVTARGGPGALDCNDLDVGLTRQGGSTAIETLVARGDVAAHDDRQAIWTESLAVAFVPRADDPSRTEVATIRADGGLQLALDGGERVFAETMEADARDRRARLEGAVNLVHGANVIDRASRVDIDEATLVYQLDGPGRFRRFDRDVLADLAEQTPATATPLEARMFDVIENVNEELRITWNDGVRIAGIAAPDGDAGDMDAGGTGEVAREATFDGQVRVVSPEMRLDHADRLVATLVPVKSTIDGEPTSATQLRTILATGHVVARNLVDGPDSGTIACDTLELQNAAAPDGRILPERMHASGNVAVSDGRQSIWTEDLVTTFAPQTAPDGADSGVPAPADPDLARIAIDRIHATGGVRARLAGGEVVYADSLEGQGLDESADLVGDITVIGPSYRLDRARRLTLERSTGTYRVASEGTFTSFVTAHDAEAAADAGPPPMQPPAPPDLPIELTAHWTDGARFVEGIDGQETLVLEGAVHAESGGAPDMSTVDAGLLAITFERAIGAEQPDGSLASGRREVTTFTAEGTKDAPARLEHRAPDPAHPDGPPRVLFVDGQQIDYHPRTFEGTVIGAGRLLVRDQPDDATADAITPEDSDSRERGGFARRGTTLFRWTEGMEMRHIVDDRYRIEMRGSVEVLNRGMDGTTATLTAQAVEAIVRRTGATDDVVSDGATDAPGSGAANPLDAGGTLEVIRLMARGGVLVRTEGRDVACDEFDYTLSTGIAMVSAAPGRMVSIMSRNAARPVTARSVIWNMDRDSITVEGGGLP